MPRRRRKKSKAQSPAASVALALATPTNGHLNVSVPARLTNADSYADLPARLGGGRVSRDSAASFTPQYFVPPASPDEQWRVDDLDANTLSKMSPTALMKLLVDISPDCARALWDWLRLGNPGWEVYAYRPGTEEEDDVATAALHKFIDLLESYYGTFDVVVNRLLIGAWLRGAFFAELVLNKTARFPIDIATPDPCSARFKEIPDEERGTVQQLGQWQDSKWMPLDLITVRYIPVDPFNASPYGRPLVSPALFSAVFALGLMHDIRRVVQQQGYSRIDISIDLDALKKAMPATLTSPTAWKTFVDKLVADTVQVVQSLQPDDTYVHMSSVVVNRAPGAADGSSLSGIGALIEALERMLVRALKTMPLLMGNPGTASEANANRQWEIHAAGVKSLQHPCETLLENFFVLGLRAQGIIADVEFKFGELRNAEMLRDAQTEALIIVNALNKYLFGLTSIDEFAMEVTGHDPDRDFPIAIPTGYTEFADPDAEPEPVPPALVLPPTAPVVELPAPADQPAEDAMDVQPDPGANRAAPISRARRGIRSGSVTYQGPRKARRPSPSPPVKLATTLPRAVVGSDLPLPPIPGSIADMTDADRERLVALWDRTFPDYAGMLQAAVVD